MGAVTEAVRRLVPASYNEMIIAPDDLSRLYSTGDLQVLADYVKYRLFSTICDPEDEAVLYSSAKNTFIGKLTTIQFIPSAVDFWDSRLASLVSTGTGEQVDYREHRTGLLKLFELLTKQVREEAKFFGLNLRGAGLLPGVSYGDNGRDILITPDPQLWPPLTSEVHLITDLNPWSTP